MQYFISLISFLIFIFLQNITTVSSEDISYNVQINFANEKFISDYYNSSSAAYFNKSSEIQILLNNTWKNLTINSVIVTNLNSSNSNDLTVTALIKTNKILDPDSLNSTTAMLNATIVSLIKSSTTNSSMSNTVPTNPSTNIFTGITAQPSASNSFTSSNLNITTIINTMQPTAYNSLPDTSTNTITNANSNSPGNLITSTNSNLNLTSISNVPQTDTTVDSSSTINGITSSLDRSNKYSSTTNTTLSISSVSLTSAAITSGIVSTLTTVSGNPKFLLIRFLKEIWILDYSNTLSQKYLNKVDELKNKMSDAFSLPKVYFTIYSLTDGSVIANTSVSIFVTDILIANSMKALNAEIVNNSTTISSTSESTPSSPTLPTYAVILISILVTVLVIVVIFMIIALICRRQRLKGYGRHQVEFVEMDNGWKYSNRNTVYQDD